MTEPMEKTPERPGGDCKLWWVTERTLPLLLIAVAASVAVAAPQRNGEGSQVRSEIRGVVLEPGTNQPVPEAEISLSTQETGPVRLNGGWKNDATKKIRTDSSGAFVVAINAHGSYRVEARKEGYIGGGFGGAPEYAEVKLTAEKPATDVRLFLARPARITGRVVDEDTGKPLAGVRLSARQADKYGGMRHLGGSSARTDAGGAFVLTELPPGEYAVEIGPQVEVEKRVMAKFTDKDVKAVDQDIERTYWPGGRGEESVLPVLVSSGATVNIGELPVKKVPYYRVLARMPVSNCAPGETVRVGESTSSAQFVTMHMTLSRVPCGKDVLIAGFAPGDYRLLFSLDDRPRETRGTASVPFSIEGANIEIDASLKLGVAVDGALVVEAGARLPDFTKVKVSLGPVDFSGYPDDPPPAVLGADGKFRIADVRAIGQIVRIPGLGPGHYVKELRHNGIPLSGDIVPLDDGALTHALTIVAGDNPGTISGAVVSRDQAVSRPFVFARKWPPAKDHVESGWTLVHADDTGKFQINGLAPGEYRLLAVRALGVPNSAVQRAMTAGKTIEIETNGFLNLTLELSEP